MKIELKNKTDIGTPHKTREIDPNKRFDLLFELIDLSIKLTPDHQFHYPHKKYLCTLRKIK